MPYGWFTMFAPIGRERADPPPCHGKKRGVTKPGERAKRRNRRKP